MSIHTRQVPLLSITILCHHGIPARNNNVIFLKTSKWDKAYKQKMDHAKYSCQVLQDWDMYA